MIQVRWVHFVNNSGTSFVQEIISWAPEERDWNFHRKCSTVPWGYANAWWFMVFFLLVRHARIIFLIFTWKHDKQLCRYGSWGICFIYATWFGLVGLETAGKTYTDSLTVRKGVEFLLKTQNEDGGWGESYLSCPNKVIYFSYMKLISRLSWTAQ